MQVNYQVIVDLIANIGMVSFPIVLIFVICDKIVDFFLSFVSNRRVKL